ncbi:MAG: NADP-dependent isocitrate dehydrogenase [Ignavibacteria bacterium]|nr:NADP-dependent isocitrate dehydrogenase [Ignavibacteria bacterium]
MSENTPITVAYGDGIGPEIMNATLDIINAAGAKLDIEVIEIGENVYNRGNDTGIEDSSWDSLLKTRVFLKAPITTPQGGGFKSLNVTARRTLGLYANVRPCVSYNPYVQTKHPIMDVVIIRENEEDLYAGIEHRQTDQVMQCLKLISEPGSEKIIRYAFEYARANNRKKVTCFMKDNIMKLTDGLFHKVFDKVGEEYPDIEKENWIVDIGAAKLATSPEAFDVIVMENLYGDILSDVTAQMTGSVGLAGSANIGDKCAMFEAIHGSAPRRAGQNSANPSGLLLGAVMMLTHIDQPEIAAKVHNAWLKTLEDGIHTYDIFREGVSKQKVGTKEFAKAVIERLGQKPKELKEVEYKRFDVKSNPANDYRNIKKAKKETVGVDIFIHWTEGTAGELGEKLRNVLAEGLQMTMISNRGTKVWPVGKVEPFCVDHWRCRYESVKNGEPITHNMIVEQLSKLHEAGYDFIKLENLCTFDGVPGFSLTKGQ